MADGRATAQRERGWLHVILALVAFLLLGLPPFTAALPVSDMLLLLLPVFAACWVAGWARGGPAVPALFWTVMAVVVLRSPLGGTSHYAAMARSWSLFVAGAFGALCVLGRQESLVHRALTATAIALLVGAAMLALPPGRFARAEHALTTELAARNAEAIAAMQQSVSEIAAQSPSAGASARALAARSPAQLLSVSAVAAPLAPALLALESLAACALAWAMYHRFSRARLGAPLARLREFAFGDQLVWGLVAGCALVALPPLRPLATTGWNLIAFFGSLYVVRGYAVFTWFIPHRAALESAVLATLAIVTLLLSLIVVPAAFGLGLSDTWFDWRRRVGQVPPRPGGPST